MRSVVLANLRSFVLPLTAAVLIPLTILGWPPALDPPSVARRLTGALVGLAGLSMLIGTVLLLVRVGRGTLAPWNPTRTLVVIGPYAHVRNPTITGVTAILAGEAIALAWDLAFWEAGLTPVTSAAAFMVANHIYFVVSEEPGQVARFGEEYRDYQRHVPRWLPRLAPWRPAGGAGGMAIREQGSERVDRAGRAP